MSRADDLARIQSGLEAARDVLADFEPGDVEVQRKPGGDPVTEADHLVDACLREHLQRDGEGWLSEETVDDRDRLDRARTWIVDPIDGTREFVRGRAEWCVSIGLVEDGRPVAGGILNPMTDELFLGAPGHGLLLNGSPVHASPRSDVEGAQVLASRSEIRRGEWEEFRDLGFDITPMGSVAYKLARVAAGLGDATWTLVAKSEWDVAGGAALVDAGGGVTFRPSGTEMLLNQSDTRLDGLVAAAPGIAEGIREMLRKF